jgi:hypothetical protein
MTDIIRYGIFRLGQIWSVVGDDGVTLGFPTRSGALLAAQTMVCAHRAFGLPTEVLVQDEVGRLLVADDVGPGFELTRVPDHPAWDPFPRPTRLRVVCRS